MYKLCIGVYKNLPVQCFQCTENTSSVFAFIQLVFPVHRPVYIKESAVRCQKLQTKKKCLQGEI